MSLRKNSRNLEDRQGYTGTSRGLLWGGECAKVIDSRLDGRLQTWAFIEIVQCPQTTKSESRFRAARYVRRPFLIRQRPRRSPANLVAPPFDEDVEVLVRREAEPIAVLLGRKVVTCRGQSLERRPTLPTSSSGSAKQAVSPGLLPRPDRRSTRRRWWLRLSGGDAERRGGSRIGSAGRDKCEDRCISYGLHVSVILLYSALCFRVAA